MTETLLVPLRPVWPGFAINTVFHATILWLLFAAPFAFRKWHASSAACARSAGMTFAAATATSPHAPNAAHPIRAEGLPIHDVRDVKLSGRERVAERSGMDAAADRVHAAWFDTRALRDIMGGTYFP
jgi:hypothetical protein